MSQLRDSRPSTYRVSPPLRWGVLGLSLAASGCISVNAAGPARAHQGAIEVGADYRPRAINRWYCKRVGSIVLAHKSANDLVLHFENRDWVVPVTESGGMVSTEYPWFNIVSYGGPSFGLATLALMAGAASQSTYGTVRVDAQTAPGGSLTVTISVKDAKDNPLPSEEERCDLAAR
jgi:hypothetical protein